MKHLCAAIALLAVVVACEGAELPGDLRLPTGWTPIPAEGLPAWGDAAGGRLVLTTVDEAQAGLLREADAALLNQDLDEVAARIFGQVQAGLAGLIANPAERWGAIHLQTLRFDQADRRVTLSLILVPDEAGRLGAVLALQAPADNHQALLDQLRPDPSAP